jgi:hypothetical protein
MDLLESVRPGGTSDGRRAARGFVVGQAGHDEAAMSTHGGADGSSATTERLIKESRDLLNSIGDRLGDEDGSVSLDPEPDEE